MLAKLRPSLTYANVMATVAVFVALGGTSYAVATGSIDSREIKNNTVGSKDIRNNGVTTRDLRNNSARGGDVRNNSLTGADVLESSLGTVPSANSANSANAAASASTASNASALGGLGADAFLRSNLVTIRNPVAVDDPAGGGVTRTTLLTAGPVTIEGECQDNGAEKIGTIRATASSAGVLSSSLIQSEPSTTASGTAEELPVGDRRLIHNAASTAPTSRVGTFSFHHPGSSTYRSGTMFISVNSAGDCAFALNAFG